MALYRCLNVKCENSIGNVAVQSEAKIVDCTLCEEKMWREDLLQQNTKAKYGSDNPYPPQLLVKAECSKREGGEK